MKTSVVRLEADHPGFNDPAYRRRRDEIAAAALAHRPGDAPPHIVYTATETATWGAVFRHLSELYPTHACREFNDALRSFEFGPNEVAQLADADARLRATTGFRLVPAPGLVEARDFLAALARRVFPATQYLRHHSAPHYTPEPDLCHELLGHAPMLAVSEYADLTERIGAAALGADDALVERVARLYWYTLEFGLVRQNGQRRAYGAGLLSSYGELSRALSGAAEVRPFDPAVAAATPNPITTYQPLLFESPSLADALGKVAAFIEAARRG